MTLLFFTPPGNGSSTNVLPGTDSYSNHISTAGAIIGTNSKGFVPKQAGAVPKKAMPHCQVPTYIRYRQSWSLILCGTLLDDDARTKLGPRTIIVRTRSVYKMVVTRIFHRTKLRPRTERLPPSNPGRRLLYRRLDARYTLGVGTPKLCETPHLGGSLQGTCSLMTSMTINGSSPR